MSVGNSKEQKRKNENIAEAETLPAASLLNWTDQI